LPINVNIRSYNFDKYYERKYGLDVFKLNNNIQVDLGVISYLMWKLLSFYKHKSLLINFFRFKKVLVKDSLVIRFLNNYFIVGYWQDEDLFKKYRNILVNDLELNQNLSRLNLNLSSEIENEACSVAVHFRSNHEISKAGENLHAKVTSTKLPLAYYLKAIDILKKKDIVAKFFVFSDNPEQARNFFKEGNDFIILNNNRGFDWEDLILMSKCKHHIIANSSFSWWSAWLSKSPNKIIIAPKNFKYTPKIPNDWIVV
jgi:hypothetical protein